MKDIPREKIEELRAWCVVAAIPTSLREVAVSDLTAVSAFKEVVDRLDALLAVGGSEMNEVNIVVEIHQAMVDAMSRAEAREVVMKEAVLQFDRIAPALWPNPLPPEIVELIRRTP